jgi:hypothetical protein
VVCIHERRTARRFWRLTLRDVDIREINHLRLSLVPADYLPNNDAYYLTCAFGKTKVERMRAPFCRLVAGAETSDKSGHVRCIVAADTGKD